MAKTLSKVNNFQRKLLKQFLFFFSFLPLYFSFLKSTLTKSEGFYKNTPRQQDTQENVHLQGDQSEVSLSLGQPHCTRLKVVCRCPGKPRSSTESAHLPNLYSGFSKMVISQAYESLQCTLCNEIKRVFNIWPGLKSSRAKISEQIFPH